MLTWLWGPLKHWNAPFPMIFSLRDSDSKLVHTISRQGVYHHSPLCAVFILPAGWFALFPVPNCVRSEWREEKKVSLQRVFFCCSDFAFAHTLLQFPPWQPRFNFSHLNSRVNPWDEDGLRGHYPDADVPCFILWGLWTTNRHRKEIRNIVMYLALFDFSGSLKYAV